VPVVRSLLALLVGGGAAAGLWLASAGKPGVGPKPEDTRKAAAAVKDELRHQLDAMKARATTLAQLPSLANVIASDAGTVKDQTAGERMFLPQEGETIELAQVSGGNSTFLMRLGPSLTEAPFTSTGEHILAREGGVLLVDVETITPLQIPTDKPPDIKGALALVRKADVKALADKAGTAAIGGASLLIAGDQVALGAAPDPKGKTEAISLDDPDKSALVVAVGTPEVPPSMPLRYGAIGAAVLGLLAAAVFGSRGRGGRKQAQPQIPAMAGGTATVPGAGPGTVTTLPPAVPQPRQGSPFGRYQPMKLLGSGGMADVYLARSVGEAGFEKQVALKIMHPHLGRVEEAVAHFLDEARLASRMNHPNIVQILDLGKNGEDYFIAMEYIEGSDLEKVLMNMRSGGRRVPVPVALGILRKVCDGLQAAHTAEDASGAPLNLVHRDVKSANVLVSKDGAVKIADFGIVKAEQQVHKTSVGQAKGTAAFMAPEQRMGSKVDVRADVYGVGAMGYELLSGLEVNLDLVGMLQKGVEGWPHLMPVSQVRPGEVPPEMDSILFKALAFEPDGRYPSCAAFEDDLSHVARARGLVATDKEIAQWIGTELALLRQSVATPVAVAPTSAV
jgi:serine/threonine-protein kinase